MTLKNIKVYYLIIEFSEYMLFYDCNFRGLVSLQENTPNSDGGSDGHQGRRTFVTEY